MFGVPVRRAHSPMAMNTPAAVAPLFTTPATSNGFWVPFWTLMLWATMAPLLACPMKRSKSSRAAP
jgi:hypothetical protein